MIKASFKVLLATLLTLALLSGIAVPLLVRARHRSRMTACVANLSTLWKLQWINKAQFSSRRPFFRDEGKAFWLKLSTTSPPLIEPGHEIYGCPLRGVAGPGQTHYLGPRIDVNTLADSDPVGCDEAFNHGFDGGGGGNVLRKSGDVLNYETIDWLRFIQTQQCIP